MTDTAPSSPDTPHEPGITPRQAGDLAAFLTNVTESLAKDDGRPRRFSLVLVTLNGIDEDGSENVGFDTISTVPPDIMHEHMRDVLHSETQ